MGRVRAEVHVTGLASTAEELWYDTSRWPTFVDGLAHVAKVEGDWPRAGRVLWDTKLDGRGRVDERVTVHEARVGQTVERRGREDHRHPARRVPARPDGCRIVLALDYRLKMDHAAAPASVDFFTRRPMRDSLKRTLARFKRELEVGDASSASGVAVECAAPVVCSAGRDGIAASRAAPRRERRDTTRVGLFAATLRAIARAPRRAGVGGRRLVAKQAAGVALGALVEVRVLGGDIGRAGAEGAADARR